MHLSQCENVISENQMKAPHYIFTDLE